jgi:predicted Na+-dependent transporter
VRAFIRDWVDARRSVAEFFLPIVLLVLVLSFVSNPAVQLFSSALWMATMLLVVVDLTWFGFRLRREIRTRFPDDEGRGHVFYGITRATQLRRLRLPKPRVRPGAQV